MAVVDIHNLVVHEAVGDSFTFTWYEDDETTLINVTGYTATCKIRRSFAASSVDLTLTSGSGITLGGAAGTVVVAITAAQATTLCSEHDETTYVYDLMLTSGGGTPYLLAQGTLTVRPTSSR